MKLIVNNINKSKFDISFFDFDSVSDLLVEFFDFDLGVFEFVADLLLAEIDFVDGVGDIAVDVGAAEDDQLVVLENQCGTPTTCWDETILIKVDPIIG